jgi:hypothetical protein
MKVLFEIKTGKLLGVQAIEGGRVDKWIDVLATVLKAGKTIMGII